MSTPTCNELAAFYILYVVPYGQLSCWTLKWKAMPIHGVTLVPAQFTASEEDLRHPPVCRGYSQTGSIELMSRDWVGHPIHSKP